MILPGRSIFTSYSIFPFHSSEEWDDLVPRRLKLTHYLKGPFLPELRSGELQRKLFNVSRLLMQEMEGTLATEIKIGGFEILLISYIEVVGEASVIVKAAMSIWHRDSLYGVGGVVYNFVTSSA